MSRTKLTLTVAGVAVAGVAGCALGALFAPASGKELRRRLAWRAEEEWRSVAQSSGRLIERAVARAWKELEDRKTRIAETMAAKVS
jgi:gas vesicle protein